MLPKHQSISTRLKRVHRMRVPPISILFMLCLQPVCAAVTHAADDGAEKYDSGWTLQIDNNLTGIGMKDRDYTAGVTLTLSGRRAQEYLFSADSPRAFIDRVAGIDRLSATPASFRMHSLQYGFELFTPLDLAAVQPVLDDRPYASLLYLSNTEQTVLPASDIAVLSSLTIGLLGLDIAGDIQNFYHRNTSSTLPAGWHNQISAGGELTAMYSLSLQKSLLPVRDSARYSHEFSSTVEGNLGFSTDINTGLSWRWGRIHSPWWSFNPAHAEYASLGMPVIAAAKHEQPEFYLWAGANLKYRFYSSIFQGQFRHSNHTLSHDEMKNLIAEAWLGFTREFANGYHLSIFIRGSSAEFIGPNAEKPLWSGIALSRAM